MVISTPINSRITDKQQRVVMFLHRPTTERRGTHVLQLTDLHSTGDLSLE